MHIRIPILRYILLTSPGLLPRFAAKNILASGGRSRNNAGTMTENAPDKTSTPSSPPPNRSKRTLLLVSVLVAIVAVWYIQRRGPELPDWGDDLNNALQAAQKDNRKVVLFLMSSPPGEIDRWLVKATLAQPGNKQALSNLNAIKVKLEISPQSDVAKKYHVTELPTMLLLSPDGKELNRRTGKIAELDFRNGFLDGSKVIKPDEKPAK